MAALKSVTPAPEPTFAVRASVRNGWHSFDRVIAYVVSSDGKHEYEVREGDDGVTYCTCRGWVALNKGPKAKGGPCKHMKAPEVKKLLALRRLGSLPPQEEDS